MIPLLMSAWGFLGRVPHVKTAAIVLLAFFIGAGVGNVRATQRAMERQQAALLNYAAERERAVGEALIAAQETYKARVEEQRTQEQRAQEVAYDLFQQGMEEASKGRAVALRALESERTKAANLAENIDGLKAVNKMLIEEFPLAEPDPGCVLSAGVRAAIDGYIRSINRDPAIGSTETSSPGVPDGPDSPNTPLACFDLAASVTDIIEHDAAMMAWVRAWQAWAREALK